MKPQLTIVSALLLLCVACGKDEDPDTDTGTPGPQQVFEPKSITATDINGVTIGEADGDDWNTDEDFDAMEQGFFGATGSAALLPASSDNSVHFWANPVQSGVAAIRFQSPAQLGRLSLVYVDHYGTVIAAPQVAASDEVINLQLDLLSVGGLLDQEHYRLYYQALSADSTVLIQGHGDFQMNN